MGDSRGKESVHGDAKPILEISSSHKMVVYIWDMDETLILLKSLLNGTYAEAFNGLKDVQKGIDIGKMWEKYILDVCDDYFFYEQIENYNQPIINALSHYDDGLDLSDYDFSQDGINPPIDEVNQRKLTYRHRVIAQKYKQGLHSILDQKTIQEWNHLYGMTDSYTEGWLTAARTLLQNCSDHQEFRSNDDTEVRCINILVTSGTLIPSLVKCLLFKLDNLLACENVYSSWDVGKLQCFSWIKDRFSGPNVQFCVIGDGWEECEAAELLKWPFVKIEPKPDGFHKFPGLTLSNIAHYLSVVYRRSDPEGRNDDAVST